MNYSMFFQLNQEMVQETYHSRIATSGDSSDEDDTKEPFHTVDDGNFKS